jgi:hypothetical protein
MVPSHVGDKVGSGVGMPAVALDTIWGIVGDEVGSGVGVRGVALGSIGTSVGDKVGSDVDPVEGVLGSGVDRRGIACDWQAVSAAKTATSRK